MTERSKLQTAASADSSRMRQASPRGSEGNRVEQRVLLMSLIGVLAIALGSVAWGLVIDSEIVVLNGVFSLLSAVSAGLSLFAARLVALPEDRKFPFGYAHIEPLVNALNGVFVLVMCVYGVLNGIEGVREGGNEIDPDGVIVFALVTTLACLGFGAWEWVMARRVGSQLMINDAKEWLMDAAFGLATFVGFVVVLLLEEPQRSVWARYADPVMVAVLSLLLLPVPIGILRQSLPEVLRMASPDDGLLARVEQVLAQVRKEHDIVMAKHHVVRTGRLVFIEIDLVVGPAFALHTVPQLDELRERIRSGIGVTLDEAWLTVAFTADPRWT